MKTSRLVTICALFAGTTISYSQENNGVWKTSGNVVESQEYFGTLNQKPLIFKSNGLEVFRLTPEGRFGLGITDPEASFHVNGSSIFKGSFSLPNIQPIDPSAMDYDLIFRDDTGALRSGSITAFADIIYEPVACISGPIPNPTWSNGENKIYSPCPQVLVGVNTTNPRVHMDVIGTTYSERVALGGDPNSFAAERLKITGYSTSSNTNLVSIGNSSSTFFTLSNQGYMNLKGQFVLTSLDSKPLIINSSTEKILQLESDGLLRVRRLKIDHDSWADYVFDENYELMPLSDVKSYIESNHHLPEIPSTQEVKENGLDVGEMNELLLKKIEELTLYVIQQQEEIESLKNKMEEGESK